MKYHLLPADQRALMKTARTRMRTPACCPKVSHDDALSVKNNSRSTILCVVSPLFLLCLGDGCGWRPGSQGHPQCGVLWLWGAAMVPGGWAPDQEVQSRWETVTVKGLDPLSNMDFGYLVKVRFQDVGPVSNSVQGWYLLRCIHIVMHFPGTDDHMNTHPSHGGTFSRWDSPEHYFVKSSRVEAAGGRRLYAGFGYPPNCVWRGNRPRRPDMTCSGRRTYRMWLTPVFQSAVPALRSDPGYLGTFWSTPVWFSGLCIFKCALGIAANTPGGMFLPVFPYIYPQILGLKMHEGK